MTRKEMIQSMLDGRSFKDTNDQSTIYFNGEIFVLERSDCLCHFLDVNEFNHENYKPIRTWEDDVLDGKPALCWVINEDINERVVAAPIDEIADKEFKYIDNEGSDWKYATPVKPSECWGGE